MTVIVLIKAVSPFDYTIVPREPCGSGLTDAVEYGVIYVASGVSDYDLAMRNAIRATWSTLAVANRYRVYFFVGRPPLDNPQHEEIQLKLEQEAERHQDVIQTNVLDR